MSQTTTRTSELASDAVVTSHDDVIMTSSLESYQQQPQQHLAVDVENSVNRMMMAGVSDNNQQNVDHGSWLP